MSRLSDIHSSYGNSFEIASANTWSSYVLDALSLPPSTMILAAPHDNDEDVGAVSIIVTDADGTPVRLTYAVKEGNGLLAEDDTLSLHIDDETLTLDSNDRLSLNVSRIIDNSSMIYVNGTITATSKDLQRTSKERYGVASIDGTTLKSNNGRIHVETTALDLANNATKQVGIVKTSKDGALKIANGTVSIDTAKISKASDSSPGVAKVDGSSITVENGFTKASLNAFNYASSAERGIAFCDQKTISCNELNVLSADFSKFNDSLVKVDGITLQVDETGMLKATSGQSIGEELVRIGEEIDSLNERIDIAEETAQQYVPIFRGYSIFEFSCNALASSLLIKPKEYGEVPDKMPTQHVSAEFTVRTNCSFKVTMKFIDNESPQVVLHQTNYNDIDIIHGNDVFSHTFQSTDNKNCKLKFSWLCKNYRSNNTNEYSRPTRILIEVRCADDTSILKTIRYTIVRYNSLYNTDIDYIGQNDELIIDQYKKTKKAGKRYELMTFVGDELITDIKPIGDTINLYPSLYIQGNTAPGQPASGTNEAPLPASISFKRRIKGSTDDGEQISQNAVTIECKDANGHATNDIIAFFDEQGNLKIRMNNTPITENE